MIAIDLDDYLGRGGGRVNILSGKDRGIDLRKEFDLDQLESDMQPVMIHIPMDLRRVTPSFVLGLFSATFAMLTKRYSSKEELKEAFFRLYEFDGEGKNSERIRDQVAETIDDLFAAKSALDEMGRGFGQPE